jgi:hypothetical protein
MRRLLASLCSVIVLLLVGTQLAFADAKQAAALMSGAPQAITDALAQSPRGPLAKAALERVLTGGKVDSAKLSAAVHNPHFAPYVVDTLIDLDVVHDVPGVDEVLVRIAQARDDAGPRGASFEISAGARLRPDLQSLSAMVDGHEVDALLKDGTIVEIKYSSGSSASGLVRKAISQLKLRGQNGARPVMLVINRPLVDDQLEHIERELGSSSRVFQATRDGVLARQVARPRFSRANVPTTTAGRAAVVQPATVRPVVPRHPAPVRSNPVRTPGRTPR